MKNVFLKDIARDLRKSAGKFAGMFAIVALGVFVFAGLGSSGMMMHSIGDDYYGSGDFFDLHVIATFGLNGKDMAALAAVEGVERITGAYNMDALVTANAVQLSARVHSLAIGEQIYAQANQPRILAGRYPERENEALVEPEVLDLLGVAIGDSVKLQSGKTADIRTKLRGDTFRIVGTVRSPLYFSTQRGSSSVGNGRADVFLLIPEENFRQSVYSEAYITVAGTAGLSTYGAAYEALVDTVADRIKAVADVRIPQRKAEATRQAWDRVAAAERDLAQARATTLSGLTAAELALNDGQQQLSGSRLALAQAESELADNRIIIDAQELELEGSLAEIEAALAALHTSEANLLQKKWDLRDATEKLSDASETLIDGKRVALDLSAKMDAGIAALQENLLAVDGQLEETAEFIEAGKVEKEALLIRFNETNDPAESAEILALLTDLNTQLTALELQREALAAAQQALEAKLDALLAEAPELKAAFRKLRLGRSSYNDQLLQYEAGRTQLDSGIASVGELIEAMESQKVEVEDGLVALQSIRLDMDAAAQTLEMNRRQLSGARQGLRDSEDALLLQKDTALLQLSAAQTAIAESRTALYDINDPKWYTLNRDTNIGYAMYADKAENISQLGGTLPMLFFLVAALVSLTTMTRLVEEQRTGMGTYKALGYSNGRILSKYLLYAMIPSALGALLGGVLGLAFFPRIVIDRAMGSLFYIPDYGGKISLPYLVGGAALAVLSTAIPTLITCRGALGEVPSSLMRPRAPKVGGKTPLEYIGILWRRLSFLYKVTFRNIFRYKKRLFMTLVGVGGSTALLLAGFGLGDSMSGMVDMQYGELFHYDLTVSFADDVTASSLQGTRKSITASPVIAQDMLLREEGIEVHMGDGNTENATMVVAAQDDLLDFITLRERIGHAPLALSGDGVIVTERMAGAFGVVVGSEMVLRDADDEEFTVTVAGICEAYLTSRVYMSREYYALVNGKAPDNNTVIAILSRDAAPEDTAALSEWALDRNGVSSVTIADTLIQSFRESLAAINTVVYLIIFIASVLAFIVLLNLTNINISERMREIATIEVLGFRDAEVSAYIYRENNIVTFAAALIGIYLGRYLHGYLCSMIDGSGMMLIRNISPLSYILSVGITMLFALTVAWATSGKLKKINMIEALKSAE